MKTNVCNKWSVPNQFEITTNEGTFFQSYDSMIAVKRDSGKIELDKKYWDYSKTTSKYLSLFLGEDKKTTEKKIESGEYILSDLN